MGNSTSIESQGQRQSSIATEDAKWLKNSAESYWDPEVLSNDSNFHIASLCRRAPSTLQNSKRLRTNSSSNRIHLISQSRRHNTSLKSQKADSNESATDLYVSLGLTPAALPTTENDTLLLEALADCSDVSNTFALKGLICELLMQSHRNSERNDPFLMRNVGKTCDASEAEVAITDTAMNGLCLLDREVINEIISRNKHLKIRGSPNSYFIRDLLSASQSSHVQSLLCNIQRQLRTRAVMRLHIAISRHISSMKVGSRSDVMLTNAGDGNLHISSSSSPSPPPHSVDRHNNSIFFPIENLDIEERDPFPSIEQIFVATSISTSVSTVMGLRDQALTSAYQMESGETNSLRSQLLQQSRLYDVCCRRLCHSLLDTLASVLEKAEVAYSSNSSSNNSSQSTSTKISSPSSMTAIGSASHVRRKRTRHQTLRSPDSYSISVVWDPSQSNTGLEFSDENVSARRVGSVSSYPAAFSKIPHYLSCFTVCLTEAKQKSNWMTIGICKVGFPSSSSSGFGRELGSWGIADDRSVTGDATLQSCGVRVNNFRKFKLGDIITLQCNLNEGWCDIIINFTEFKHRFNIPPGSPDEYRFGATFANDHKLKIVPYSLSVLQSSRTVLCAGNHVMTKLRGLPELYAQRHRNSSNIVVDCNVCFRSGIQSDYCSFHHCPLCSYDLCFVCSLPPSNAPSPSSSSVNMATPNYAAKSSPADVPFLRASGDTAHLISEGPLIALLQDSPISNSLDQLLCLMREDVVLGSSSLETLMAVDPLETNGGDILLSSWLKASKNPFCTIPHQPPSRNRVNVHSRRDLSLTVMLSLAILRHSLSGVLEVVFHLLESHSTLDKCKQQGFKSNGKTSAKILPEGRLFLEYLFTVEMVETIPPHPLFEAQSQSRASSDSNGQSKPVYMKDLLTSFFDEAEALKNKDMKSEMGDPTFDLFQSLDWRYDTGLMENERQAVALMSVLAAASSHDLFPIISDFEFDLLIDMIEEAAIVLAKATFDQLNLNEPDPNGCSHVDSVESNRVKVYMGSAAISIVNHNLCRLSETKDSDEERGAILDKVISCNDSADSPGRSRSKWDYYTLSKKLSDARQLIAMQKLAQHTVISDFQSSEPSNGNFIQQPQLNRPFFISPDDDDSVDTNFKTGFMTYRQKLQRIMNLIIGNPRLHASGNSIGTAAVFYVAYNREVMMPSPSEQFKKISSLLLAAQDNKDTFCERSLCMHLLTSLDGHKLLNLFHGSENEDAERIEGILLRLADMSLHSKFKNIAYPTSAIPLLVDGDDDYHTQGLLLQTQVLKVLEPCIIQSFSNLSTTIQEKAVSETSTSGLHRHVSNESIIMELSSRLIKCTEQLIRSAQNGLEFILDFYDQAGVANPDLGNYAKSRREAFWRIEEEIGKSHIGALVPLALFAFGLLWNNLINGGRQDICHNFINIIDSLNLLAESTKSVLDLLRREEPLRELSALSTSSTSILGTAAEKKNENENRFSTSPEILAKSTCKLFEPLPESVMQWETLESNRSLEFTDCNTTARRPGSVSCYPAAFALVPSAYSTISFMLSEAGSRTNWLSIGVAKVGFASSSSDGFGRTTNSWGIADDRSKDLESSFFAAYGRRICPAPRKLKVGDIITVSINLNLGTITISVNHGEFSHTFGDGGQGDNNIGPHGKASDFYFGATFANDHQLKIIAVSAPPTIQSLAATALSPVSSISWIHRLEEEVRVLQLLAMRQMIESTPIIEEDEPSTSGVQEEEMLACAGYLDSPLFTNGYIEKFLSRRPTPLIQFQQLTPTATFLEKSNILNAKKESFEGVWIESLQEQWELLHQLTDAPNGLGSSQQLVAVMKQFVQRDRGSEAGPNHIVHAACAAMIWHEGLGQEALNLARSSRDTGLAKPSKALIRVWSIGQELRTFFPEEEDDSIDNLDDSPALMRRISIERVSSLPPPQSGQGPLNDPTLAAVRRARLLLSYLPARFNVNSPLLTTHDCINSHESNRNTSSHTIDRNNKVIADAVLDFIKFGSDPTKMRKVAENRGIAAETRACGFLTALSFLDKGKGDLKLQSDVLRHLAASLEKISSNPVVDNSNNKLEEPSNGMALRSPIHYSACIRGCAYGSHRKLFSAWSSLLPSVLSCATLWLERLHLEQKGPKGVQNFGFCNMLPHNAREKREHSYDGRSRNDIIEDLTEAIISAFSTISLDYSDFFTHDDMELLYKNGILTVLKIALPCNSQGIRIAAMWTLEMLINCCSDLCKTNNRNGSNLASHENFHILPFLHDLLNLLSAHSSSSASSYTNLITLRQTSQMPPPFMERSSPMDFASSWILKGEKVCDPMEEGDTIYPSSFKGQNTSAPVCKCPQHAYSFWLWIPYVDANDGAIISKFEGSDGGAWSYMQISLCSAHLKVVMGSTVDAFAAMESLPSSTVDLKSLDMIELTSKCSLRPCHWYHIGISVDNSLVQLYVNSSLSSFDKITPKMQQCTPFQELFSEGGSDKRFPYFIGQVPPSVLQSLNAPPPYLYASCVIDKFRLLSRGVTGEELEAIALEDISISSSFTESPPAASNLCFTHLQDWSTSVKNNSSTHRTVFTSFPTFSTGQRVTMKLKIKALGDSASGLSIGVIHAIGKDKVGCKYLTCEEGKVVLKSSISSSYVQATLPAMSPTQKADSVPGVSDSNISPASDVIETLKSNFCVHDEVAFHLDLIATHPRNPRLTIAIDTHDSGANPKKGATIEYSCMLLPDEYCAVDESGTCEEGAIDKSIVFAISLGPGQDLALLKSKGDALSNNVIVNNVISWDLGFEKPAPNFITAHDRHHWNRGELVHTDAFCLLNSILRVSMSLLSLDLSKPQDDSSMQEIGKFFIDGRILESLLALTFASKTSTLRLASTTILCEILPLLSADKILTAMNSLGMFTTISLSPTQSPPSSQFWPLMTTILGNLLNPFSVGRPHEQQHDWLSWDTVDNYGNIYTLSLPCFGQPLLLHQLHDLLYCLADSHVIHWNRNISTQFPKLLEKAADALSSVKYSDWKENTQVELLLGFLSLVGGWFHGFDLYPGSIVMHKGLGSNISEPFLITGYDHLGVFGDKLTVQPLSILSKYSYDADFSGGKSYVSFGSLGNDAENVFPPHLLSEQIISAKDSSHSFLNSIRAHFQHYSTLMSLLCNGCTLETDKMSLTSIVDETQYHVDDISKEYIVQMIKYMSTKAVVDCFQMVDCNTTCKVSNPLADWSGYLPNIAKHLIQSLTMHHIVNSVKTLFSEPGNEKMKVTLSDIPIDRSVHFLKHFNGLKNSISYRGLQSKPNRGNSSNFKDWDSNTDKLANTFISISNYSDALLSTMQNGYKDLVVEPAHFLHKTEMFLTPSSFLLAPTTNTPMYSVTDSVDVNSLFVTRSESLEPEAISLVTIDRPISGSSTRFKLRCTSGTTHCRIRALPSLESQEVGDLKNGSIIEVSSLINGFYRLSNGKGFVMSRVDNALEWIRLFDSDSASLTVGKVFNYSTDHEGAEISKNLFNDLESISHANEYKLLCTLLDSWPQGTSFEVLNSGELLIFLRLCGLGTGNVRSHVNGEQRKEISSLHRSFLKMLSRMTCKTSPNLNIEADKISLVSNLCIMTTKLFGQIHSNQDTEKKEPLPPPVVLESCHEYENNTDFMQYVSIPNATGLEIIFDSESSTERNYDYVSFYADEQRSQMIPGTGKYSGRRHSSDKNWPGVNGQPSLIIEGRNDFWLSFITDGSNTDWGWRMTVHGIFQSSNNSHCDMEITKSDFHTENDDEKQVAPIPLTILNRRIFIHMHSPQTYLGLGLPLAQLLVGSCASYLLSSPEGRDMLWCFVRSLNVIPVTEQKLLLHFLNTCTKLVVAIAIRSRALNHFETRLLNVIADGISAIASWAEQAYVKGNTQNVELSTRTLMPPPLMQAIAQAAIVVSTAFDVTDVTRQPETGLNVAPIDDDMGQRSDNESKRILLSKCFYLCNEGKGIGLLVDSIDSASPRPLGLGPLFPPYSTNVLSEQSDASFPTSLPVVPALHQTFSAIASLSESNNNVGVPTKVETYSHTLYLQVKYLNLMLKFYKMAAMEDGAKSKSQVVSENPDKLIVGVVAIPLDKSSRDIDSLHHIEGSIGDIPHSLGIPFSVFPTTDSVSSMSHGMVTSDIDIIENHKSANNNDSPPGVYVEVGDIISITLNTSLIGTQSWQICFRKNGVLLAEHSVDTNPTSFKGVRMPYGLLNTGTGMEEDLDCMLAMAVNLPPGCEVTFLDASDIPASGRLPSTLYPKLPSSNSLGSSTENADDASSSATTTLAEIYTGKIIQKWVPEISDTDLLFSNNDTCAKRPGNVSCYPAALVPIDSPSCAITMVLQESPIGPNSMSIGIAKANFPRNGSDGMGPTSHSWGLIESRSSGDGKIYSNRRHVSTFRKMVDGDSFAMRYERSQGKAWLIINNNELIQEFDVHEPGEIVDLVFGATFCNDHSLKIENVPPPSLSTLHRHSSKLPWDINATISIPPTITAGGGAASTSTAMVVAPPPIPPSLLNASAPDIINVSKVWDVGISQSQLEFSNGNKTAKRPGSVSTYPAAFSSLKGPKAQFTVVLSECPAYINSMSIGVCVEGFPTSGQKSFGERDLSWGIFNNRSMDARDESKIGSCGHVVSRFRHMKAGDIFSFLVDLTTSPPTAKLFINGGEFIHTFILPIGKKFVFGATFCNDHVLSIIDTTLSNETKSRFVGFGGDHGLFSINNNGFPLHNTTLSDASLGGLGIVNSYMMNRLRLSHELTVKAMAVNSGQSTILKEQLLNEVGGVESNSQSFYRDVCSNILSELFPITVSDQALALTNCNKSSRWNALPNYLHSLKKVNNIFQFLLHDNSLLKLQSQVSCGEITSASSSSASTSSKDSNTTDCLSIIPSAVYGELLQLCMSNMSRVVELNERSQHLVVEIPGAVGYIVEVISISSSSPSLSQRLQVSAVKDPYSLAINKHTLDLITDDDEESKVKNHSIKNLLDCSIGVQLSNHLESTKVHGFDTFMKTSKIRARNMLHEEVKYTYLSSPLPDDGSESIDTFQNDGLSHSHLFLPGDIVVRGARWNCDEETAGYCGDFDGGPGCLGDVISVSDIPLTLDGRNKGDTVTAPTEFVGETAAENKSVSSSSVTVSWRSTKRVITYSSNSGSLRIWRRGPLAINHNTKKVEARKIISPLCTRSIHMSISDHTYVRKSNELSSKFSSNLSQLQPLSADSNVESLPPTPPSTYSTLDFYPSVSLSQPSLDKNEVFSNNFSVHVLITPILLPTQVLTHSAYRTERNLIHDWLCGLPPPIASSQQHSLTHAHPHYTHANDDNILISSESRCKSANRSNEINFALVRMAEATIKDRDLSPEQILKKSWNELVTSDTLPVQFPVLMSTLVEEARWMSCNQFATEDNPTSINTEASRLSAIESNQENAPLRKERAFSLGLDVMTDSFVLTLSTSAIMPLRFALIQALNNELTKCIDLINLHIQPEIRIAGLRSSEDGDDSQYSIELIKSIATLIQHGRGLIFSCVKNCIIQGALARSENQASSSKFELILSRSRCIKFSNRGEVDEMGRWSVFGQAFRKIHGLHPGSLRRSGQLWDTIFAGERAQDAGGPYRESWSAIVQDLMSSYVPLLRPSPNNIGNTGTYREAFILNPEYLHNLRSGDFGIDGLLTGHNGRIKYSSKKGITGGLYKDIESLVTTRLEMFVFLGKLLGSAARNKNFLDLSFPPIVWKLLLGETISLEDLRAVDSTLVNWILGLKQRKNLNEENYAIAYPDLFFTAVSVDGSTVELHPGGENESVTWSDIDRFCHEFTIFKLNEMQISANAIRLGLQTQLPLAILNLLRWDELEECVCGNPVIDIALLKSVTEYERGCTASDQHIIWLWELLEKDFSDQDRKAFLRFTWGRSRLPLNKSSFSQVLKIQGLSKTNPDSYFPIAHTCFFSIEIPKYSSKSIMREKISFAIWNCSNLDGDETQSSIRAGNMGLEL